MITHLPAFLARSFGIRRLMVISNLSVYISQALRDCFSPDCLLIQTASKDSPRPPIKIVYLWQKWLSTRPFFLPRKILQQLNISISCLIARRQKRLDMSQFSQFLGQITVYEMTHFICAPWQTHFVIFCQPMIQQPPKRKVLSSNAKCWLTEKISLFFYAENWFISASVIHLNTLI